MDCKPFTFDVSNPKLLHFEFPGRYTTDELAQALKVVTDFLQNQINEPFCILTDASKRTESSAMNRSILAEFVKTNDKVFQDHCKGWAVVTNSALIKGALTAIFWVKSPNWQMKFFTETEKAQEWLGKQLPV